MAVFPLAPRQQVHVPATPQYLPVQVREGGRDKNLQLKTERALFKGTLVKIWREHKLKNTEQSELPLPQGRYRGRPQAGSVPRGRSRPSARFSLPPPGAQVSRDLRERPRPGSRAICGAARGGARPCRWCVAMAALGAEELRAGGPGLGLAPVPGPVPPHPGVSRRRGRTLLVRHLPAELTAAEKEDLLQHFGAVSVRVLSDHGRLVRPGAGAGGRAEPGARRGAGIPLLGSPAGWAGQRPAPGSCATAGAGVKRCRRASV